MSLDTAPSSSSHQIDRKEHLAENTENQKKPKETSCSNQDTAKPEKTPTEQAGENIKVPGKTDDMTNSMFGTLIWWGWFVCTTVLLSYICLAGVVLFSKAAKMEVIFSNRFTAPWFWKLSDCHSYGLTSCENLQLSTENGNQLGAWLISPYSRQIIVHDAYILYLHGNGGSRGDSHCVNMYNKLTRLGYHVLAIDYRGFGDSEGFPTEEGLLEDAKAAYKLMAKRYSAFPLYIWGHSLGSAVAVQLAAWLNSDHSPNDLRLNGLILEAPFNNMVDGIRHTPLAAPIVSFVPDFESYVADVKSVFESSYWIQKVSSPVVILHDTSDGIINISLGRKLYQVARDVGMMHVSMVEFKENLGHFQIHASKKLRSVLQNFIQLSS